MTLFQAKVHCVKCNNAMEVTLTKKSYVKFVSNIFQCYFTCNDCLREAGHKLAKKNTALMEMEIEMPD